MDFRPVPGGNQPVEFYPDAVGNHRPGPGDFSIQQRRRHFGIDPLVQPEGKGLFQDVHPADREVQGIEMQVRGRDVPAAFIAQFRGVFFQRFLDW